MNTTQTNQAENANATSTPAAAEPTPQAQGEAPKAVEAPAVEVKTETLLVNFPCVISEERQTTVVKYGDELYIFPIGKTADGKIETATIDSALLRGRGTKRLQPIKSALKIAGRTNDDVNRKWFNTTVRDVWHKVLRFAATDALAHGKPVSLGLSIRTSKKTGAQVLTSKHGFEHLVTPPRVSDTESKVAARADRLAHAVQVPEESKPERVDPVHTAKPAKAGKAAKASKIKALVSIGDAMPNISIAPSPAVETPASEPVAA